MKLDKIVYRIATAILFENRILIESNSYTKSGFNISSEPYFILSLDSENNEIGKTIRLALEQNKYNVNDPDFKNTNRNNKRFKTTNVKSEKQFMKRSKCILIESKGDIISFIPTRNGGIKGDTKGFHHLKDYKTDINALSTDDILGLTARKTWEKCTFL
jgi:hypothetical protein